MNSVLLFLQLSSRGVGAARVQAWCPQLNHVGLRGLDLHV